MLIDFNKMDNIEIPGMNNGTGTMAKMFADNLEGLCFAESSTAVRSAPTDTTTEMISISSFLVLERQLVMGWMRN